MTDATALPRFVATVRDVTEVALVGDADFEQWREVLRAPGLTPGQDENGRVPVRILACASRYKGLAFQECSVAVGLEANELETQVPVYLVCAFNSRRCFAWSERTFFGTPYEHATVQVRASPAGFSVAGARTFVEAHTGRTPEGCEAIQRDETVQIDFPAKPGKPSRVYYRDAVGTAARPAVPTGGPLRSASALSRTPPGMDREDRLPAADVAGRYRSGPRPHQERAPTRIARPASAEAEAGLRAASRRAGGILNQRVQQDSGAPFFAGIGGRRIGAESRACDVRESPRCSQRPSGQASSRFDTHACGSPRCPKPA